MVIFDDQFKKEIKILEAFQERLEDEPFEEADEFITAYIETAKEPNASYYLALAGDIAEIAYRKGQKESGVATA